MRTVAYSWQNDQVFNQDFGRPLTAAEAAVRRNELHDFDYVSYFNSRDGQASQPPLNQENAQRKQAYQPPRPGHPEDIVNTRHPSAYYVGTELDGWFAQVLQYGKYLGAIEAMAAKDKELTAAAVQRGAMQAHYQPPPMSIQGRSIAAPSRSPSAAPGTIFAGRTEASRILPGITRRVPTLPAVFLGHTTASRLSSEGRRLPPGTGSPPNSTLRLADDGRHPQPGRATNVPTSNGNQESMNANRYDDGLSSSTFAWEGPLAVVFSADPGNTGPAASQWNDRNGGRGGPGGGKRGGGRSGVYLPAR